MNNMTALVSAFARAYHTEKYAVPVFRDSAAKQLLGEDYEQIAKAMRSGIAFFAPDFQGTEKEALRYIMDKHLSPTPLARSAFGEESLRTAQRVGAEQYLLLGAGYDSFGLRQPEGAENLEIFEVDLPEIQLDKRGRMKRAGLDVAPNLHFLTADLRYKGWIGALKDSAAFSQEKITFCSLLGLLYYLPKEDFGRLLTQLADLLPAGSSLVFDYPMSSGTEGEKQKLLAQEAGEPMQAVYDYRELEQLLSRCGFRIYEQLEPAEITERYFQLHNLANPDSTMKAADNVAFCLAVRKDY